jgi:nucleoside-triphosphatase THEP1
LGAEIRGRAAILTGERGVGKTTLCLEFARGRPEFAGIVSPAIFDPSGQKVGFSALCLQTGERWDLGRSDITLDGPVYGKYSFSAAGIARAIQCLQTALELPDRIIVLDEIGPLEMQRGEGLAPILPALAGAGNLLLVTRPLYSPLVADLLPSHSCQEFLLDPCGREPTAAAVLLFLRARIASSIRRKPAP